MSEVIKVEFYDGFNTLKDTMKYKCESFSYECDTEIAEIIKENQYCYALVLKSSGEIIYLKHKDFSPQEALYKSKER